jgi:hypothetical protein
MRYNTSVLSETVTILGRFQSGRTAAQVTVALFNAATGASIPVTSPNTAEIGTTGVYRFSTSQITTQPTAFTEILYIMTDTITNRTHDGKIVLGGHVDKLDATVSSRATSIQASGISIQASGIQADVDVIQATMAQATGIDDLRTRLPSSLTPTGKMRSHVESMDPDVITAAVIASGAITPSEAPALANLDVPVSSRAGATGIDDIRTRLPSSLTVTGKMRSHVEGMDPDTITSGVIATDAVGALELSPDAIAEIQAGLAQATGIDDLRTRLPSTLTPTGKMRSRVEEMDPNTITAGVIATDAMGALELSADAVAEIQAGLAQTTGIDDLRLRIPSTLTPQGRMRSHVEDLNDDVITAAKIASGAIGVSEAPLLVNLDATVSSRASQVSLTSLIGAVIAETTTVAAGSTPGEVRTPLTKADGYFDGMVLVVIDTTGTAARQVERYLNVNGAFTPDDPFPFTPTVGTTVLVLATRGSRKGGAG